MTQLPQNKLLGFTAALPELHDVISRVYDTDGQIVNPGATVEVAVPVPTSAKVWREAGIPVGTLLTVLWKSGAAFMLEDERGERHIALAKRLRVLVPGDPSGAAAALILTSTGFSVTDSMIARARRGANARNSSRTAAAPSPKSRNRKAKRPNENTA